MTSMHTGHRIITGVDGSPSSQAAVDWVARQAELTGSTLEVVTPWEWSNSYAWALPFPAGYDPAADAQRALDVVLQPVQSGHPNVHIQSIVIEDHPAPVLVEASRTADLLVVGSRGHGSSQGCCLDRSASIA
jgi:nucleotide-binding universal stress UspA family protein